jgi:nitrate reductase delta subunit
MSALAERKSPYASVLAAVLELAGERADPVTVPAEPSLDATWEEPAAFDGCPSRAPSGAPQPVHFVRPAAARAAA